MKKLFTILLAAGMISMYACSSSTNNTENAGDSTAVTTPAPAETAPAAAPADSSMPADTAHH